MEGGIEDRDRGGFRERFLKAWKPTRWAGAWSGSSGISLVIFASVSASKSTDLAEIFAALDDPVANAFDLFERSLTMPVFR
jgi:hypothetical protein